MIDEDFKIETIKSQARIEQKVDHIVNNMPACEKEVIKNKIKNNRFMIIGVYTLLGSILLMGFNFILRAQ